VLCAAGVAKLRAAPRRRRDVALALAELGVGVWSLFAFSFAAALVVAAAYLTFTGVASVQARRQLPCACFGRDDRPPTALHIALNGALAAVAGMAAVWRPAPADGGDVALAVLAAGCLVVAYTAGPGAVVDRAANALGGLLERRTDRRGMLARATLAGTAFALAPVRYLVRPGSAWAQIGPGDCGGGLCEDGYSAFCCEIQYGNNRCPPNTYPAGWWMCTYYAGGGLCADEHVRYYVDCNRTPGTIFPGGCQCANGDCNERRVDCNAFRYGQCNTQIFGTTEVVCRLMICQNPATVSGMNCNGTVAVDNSVCYHEAWCLEGLAVQLPGGGGA
jgi:hypothetical protein